MLKALKHIILVGLLLVAGTALAQPRYNMSNRTVSDCEGTLVDSENSKDPQFPTGYDHNEDYYFSICLPGSPKITINFSVFQLETDKFGNAIDYIEVYDGPNQSSPLIGKYSGTNVPGSISSTGDCITIYFHSDGNVVKEGFELTWSVVPPDPIPPVIRPIPNVTCKSTSVVISFDQPIPCNQLRPSSFTFSGPSGSQISNVVANNCVNGSATSATLFFNTPLDQSGTYTIVFQFTFIDICNRPFRFEISATFNIIDCPLQVEIDGDSTVCTNDCVTLTADVKGGNPANYKYSWQPGGETTVSIQACPTSDQVYTVTVTDGASQPASATKTVKVLPLPEAGTNVSYCRFDPPVTLIGSPGGGSWTGPGITNGAAGTFNPPSAGPGVHKVYYIAPNGCRDDLEITIFPVSAGPPQSACRNSAPFQLNGTPAGGTWTGTGISPGGLYTPNTAGTYTVTYTEPVNGCRAQQIVRVVDSLDIPPMDSMAVCINQAQFNIPFSPPGGTWAGTGIVNAGQGAFNAATAGQGKFILTYRINGCLDSTNISVDVINAGADILVCPVQAPFILSTGTPAGGKWTGQGVTDNGDSTYTFDPAAIPPNGNYVLTYSRDSCSDAMVVYLYNTTVADDTLQYCPYETPVKLDPAFYKPNIPNGAWSGTGVIQPDSIDPRLLKTGMNYIYYEYLNNGCIDSLRILIKPKPVAQQDVIICPQAGDFNLSAAPAKGTWSGFGITDTAIGTFSPSFTGVGNFDVVYTLNSCTDTTRVSVKTTQVSFLGLKTYYCLNNTSNILRGNPPGGIYSGPGMTDSTFHPDLAGAGTHRIVYSFGTGNCIVRDTQMVKVLPPIDFTFLYPPKTLCYGDSILVRVKITGGDSTKKFHYTWNPDKGDTSQIFVRPTQPATYGLTVDEGCSVPQTRQFSVNVHPEIQYTQTTGRPVCFGDPQYTADRFFPCLEYQSAQHTGQCICTERKVQSDPEQPEHKLQGCCTGEHSAPSLHRCKIPENTRGELPVDTRPEMAVHQPQRWWRHWLLGLWRQHQATVQPRTKPRKGIC
jgi:hypothetical protein